MVQDDKSNIEEKKDSYIEDLKQKASKVYKDMTPKEIEEATASTEFLNKMQEIDMPKDSYRVIFTDGDMQLLFDNGEFYEISTVDSTRARIKKTKKEARDKYIEYFIRYVLNPIIKQAETKKRVKNIEKVMKPRVKQTIKEKKNKNIEREIGER